MISKDPMLPGVRWVNVNIRPLHSRQRLKKETRNISSSPVKTTYISCFFASFIRAMALARDALDT